MLAYKKEEKKEEEVEVRRRKERREKDTFIEFTMLQGLHSYLYLYCLISIVP